MLSWDLEKEQNVKVLAKYTLNESNKRGDWLKSWLMLNDYTALNTMFRKTPKKKTSFVSPKGKQKHFDYILTQRRYLRNVKDAEANDMIHMGSDHRCVMATFLINMPEKNTHVRRENKKHETNVNVEHKRKAKNTNIEKSELEERCQDITVTTKKAAATKENEVHDTRNNAKDQIERKNAAAAAEAESTLVDAEAQETERRSMKRSSKAETQRVEKLNTSIDVRTGGRLHTVEVMMKRNAVNETELQESDCRNNAHLVMSILNTIQKNISVHKFHIRSKRQVFPAEARACSRTTTKKHR